MTTYEQLKETISQYNDSAEKDWQDEKIVTLCGYKENEDGFFVSLAIGKWDSTYHDVFVENDGAWRIIKESGKNALLNDVMDYMVLPSLPH